MRTFFLSLGLLALVASEAPSQWGTRCAPVGVPASPYHVQPAREWRQVPDDPGRWHLFVNGHQAGAYCPRLGIYRALEPQGWGLPSAAPADLPAAARAATRPSAPTSPVEDFLVGNQGLCPDWLRQRQGQPDVIYHGSTRTTLGTALQSIESVPDYRTRPRLTVSGTEADRVQLRAAAKAAGLAQTYLWADYPPDHWHLRDRDGKPGFRTTADPTLTVQAPDGTVQGRMDGVSPADLAKLRVQPPYDPNKDPDPRKPKPPEPGPAPNPSPFDFSKMPAWAWVIGAGILVLLLLRRNP